MEDEPRPGRQISVSDAFTCKKVDDFLQVDRSITIHQLPQEMGISYKVIGVILHKRLG